MKYIFLSVRDYHFIGFLRQGYSEETAYNKCKLAIIATFSGWYLSLVMGFAVICYKLGFRPTFNHNFLLHLLFGILIVVPYILVMWWVTEKLMRIPVDEPVSYKKLTKITWTIVVVGILMTAITPAFLQQVLPDINF